MKLRVVCKEKLEFETTDEGRVYTEFNLTVKLSGHPEHETHGHKMTVTADEYNRLRVGQVFEF